VAGTGLDGPRAKLARAAEHLGALRAAIDEYLAAGPYRTPHEYDAPSGEYVFRLVGDQPLPLRLGIIVGDFAHNARSALDHLVYALSNGAYPRSSQFPIALTERDYRDQARRRLRGVAADARAAIELVPPVRHQPDARLHPLAALDELSNVDKHRLIHPTYATSADERPDVTVEFLEGPEESHAEVIYRASVPLADGAVVLRLRLHPPGAQEPNVVVKGGLPVDIAFGDGRLQLRALHDILRAVAEIVERYVGPYADAAPPGTARE
jgi:hypothetical protein